MSKTEPLIILAKSKPLADLIKIEDELRDDYEDFRFIYLDAMKQRGLVPIVKFSDALAKLDFDLDCLESIIDRLESCENRERIVRKNK